MEKQIYICTVQLAFEDCESRGQAEDAVTAALSENLKDSGAILDWQYLQVGGQFLYPTEKIINPSDLGYEEGEAFL